MRIMVKDKLNLTIECGLKQKAEAQNLNISEAVEQILKEKTKDTTKTTKVLEIEKYGITLISNNWVVGVLSDGSMVEGNIASNEYLVPNTQTYHPNLNQALIQLSKRLIEDKIKGACREKPLELKELALLIKEHHIWFVSLVRGL